LGIVPLRIASPHGEHDRCLKEADACLARGLGPDETEPLKESGGLDDIGDAVE
jgi:hypothetical protein